MLFEHFDWDLTHQVRFLYIYFAQPSHELERPALENGHTFEQGTDICSCKFSAKVSLMLENAFLVPSLGKLNHISLCFTQISTKSPAKLLIPFREGTVFFEVIPGILGRSVNFNIKISNKTARVSRLSVSCDYADMQVVERETDYIDLIRNEWIFRVSIHDIMSKVIFNFRLFQFSLRWKIGCQIFLWV